MAEWNIQSRSHRCQSCNGGFTDKQAYHTLLFTDVGQMMRLDVCEKCWNNQYRHGANERRGFISHWQGLYLTPPAAPPEAIQKDTAETLLRTLIERNEPDPRYQAVCYILAVMLERKRIIKVKDQIIQVGSRIFIYEQPKTGDLFAITDPNLRLDTLESVQRDVAHLLEHGVTAIEEIAPIEGAAGDSDISQSAEAESPGAAPEERPDHSELQSPLAPPQIDRTAVEEVGP